MARDLDEILLETVRVRRRRLRDAFLHGTLRTRRVASDNVRRLVAGAVLAAVTCAACVGVSFVRAHLGDHSLGAPFPVRPAAVHRSLT